MHFSIHFTVRQDQEHALSFRHLQTANRGVKIINHQGEAITTPCRAYLLHVDVGLEIHLAHRDTPIDGLDLEVGPLRDSGGCSILQNDRLRTGIDIQSDPGCRDLYRSQLQAPSQGEGSSHSGAGDQEGAIDAGNGSKAGAQREGGLLNHE